MSSVSDLRKNQPVKWLTVTAMLMGVNPFDQPGVESYKRNMFALLAKPGYEKETEAIRARI